MNKEQTKNLAKYSYDISKITLATSVFGQIIHPDGFKAWVVIIGLIITIIFLIFGYLLDSKIKS
ncbi:MAG: hypothetical protein IIA88_03635 [Bacteroidetes bacterium]|nr:hypothetical protein [Bacteroidota bacterium]